MEQEKKHCKLSVCFFMHLVQEGDSKETINLERNNFYKSVHENPNVWREFINEKEGEHLVYNCSNIINVGNHQKTNVVDIDNFVEAVKILSYEKKMKKNFYACILKSLKEGLWGNGFEKMTPCL